MSLEKIVLEKTVTDELFKTLQFNQNLIDTSPVGITSVNKNGQIIFANERAETLLGLTKKDITQLTYNAPNWKITDINGNPFPEKKLPFSLVKKTKEAINNVRHAIEWPNGKRVCLSINAKPILNAEGNFMGMVASLEDITQKLAIENQIKQKNTFLNAIITHAAEGLCVYHNCMDYPFIQFTVWNDKMTHITGYTMNEINKLGWYQTLFHDDEAREKAMNTMHHVMKDTNNVTEECLITRKDQKQRNISIATSVISTIDNTENIMALINDVTEKHKAKIAVEEANEKLKKLNESKDRFLEILAHDLKGPLGASLSISKDLYNTLQEGDNDESTKRFAAYIVESVQRSFRLLEDLLEWSQAQTKKAEYNPKSISLSPFVQSTINSVTPIAKNKGVQITYNCINDLTIVADENMIRTIMRNLLCNAIKYSYENGTIYINALQNTHETIISIKDEGVGMDKEQLSNLFRIDKSYSTNGTDNEKGTGLGLLLCKELVKYHNGKIWATSTSGKGATFSFTVPASLCS